MALSINIEHFLKHRPGDKERSYFDCVDIAYNSGFRLVDLAGSNIDDVSEIADYIKSRGMKVNQSHCPYNRYAKEDYSVFSEKVMNSLKKAHDLGSGIFVVHGDEFDFGAMVYAKSTALEFNYKFFSPVVEYACANGMKVAFENVFQEQRPEQRFCSETEDLISLVEKFNTHDVGICWDFGHAKVQYDRQDYVSQLKLAGSHVISTHVHDNYYGKDLHLLPFIGDTDWEGTMKTLKDIGYGGDFTFELVYDNIPEALILDYMKLLYRSGEYLLNM